MSAGCHGNPWLDPQPADEPEREPIAATLRWLIARSVRVLERLALNDPLTREEWTTFELALLDAQEAVGEERRARFADNNRPNSEGGF